MLLFKRLFRFFIFSSLFISICAVVMAHQTFQLLNIPTPGWYFFAFIFFSTVCSYNLHWSLTTHSVKSTQRIEWAKKYKHIHQVLFFIGLAGSIAFFIPLWQHWPWLMLAALLTFLYTAPKIPQRWLQGLKKIAIGKTLFLTMVWTYVTTALPLLVTGSAIEEKAWLFISSRFFLIYAICILFDYRDREDDKQDGIRSLITYLDDQGIRRLFYFSLLLFSLATISLYWYAISPTTLAILLIPGFLTGMLYNYSTRNFSDIYYYFVLDGLMMLSALLMLIFSF